MPHSNSVTQLPVAFMEAVKSGVAARRHTSYITSEMLQADELLSGDP
jgi:hypothetical protein